MALRRLFQIQRILQSQSRVQIGTRRTMATEDCSQFLLNIFASPDKGGTAENKCKQFCSYYRTLDVNSRLDFLSLLAQQYGISHEHVIQGAQALTSSQERGEAHVVQSLERLRSAITPRYQSLFQQIGRIEGGVKFLVDMRADLLNFLQGNTNELDSANFSALNRMLRELFALWFSVGFLDVQRITWMSPCDLVQKISDYEAVHPVRNWTDLKQRVGPYRRCYVFTHRSMPREPVVVLHTALTSEISSSIHTIIRNPRFRASTSEPSPLTSSTTPSVDSGDDGFEEEDLSQIKAAIFYSISSTNKGLQGVELGNYLIKSVVQRLQSEFPHLSQFSSLSPIPGFRDWLLRQINSELNRKGDDSSQQHLLTPSEMKSFEMLQQNPQCSALETFKRLVLSNQWITEEEAINALKPALLRLCSRYLYLEKRRGMALNPVASFHLTNGSVLWRINFLADTSIRGLGQSCGLMVNYRYYLGDTETNSKNYLLNQEIAASPEVMELVQKCQEASTQKHGAQS